MYLQKVELAAQKVNSRIQRKGQVASESLSGEESSGDLERKELLPEADETYCRERRNIHFDNNYLST